MYLVAIILVVELNVWVNWFSRNQMFLSLLSVYHTSFFPFIMSHLSFLGCSIDNEFFS